MSRSWSTSKSKLSSQLKLCLKTSMPSSKSKLRSGSRDAQVGDVEEAKLPDETILNEQNYLEQVLSRTPNWQDREILFSISNNRWEYDKSKSLSFIPKLLKFWHFLDHFDIFLHFLIRVHLPDWGWDSISGGFKVPEVQLKCIFKGNPILSFGSDIKPLNSPRDFKI